MVLPTTYLPKMEIHKPRDDKWLNSDSIARKSRGIKRTMQFILIYDFFLIKNHMGMYQMDSRSLKASEVCTY